MSYRIPRQSLPAGILFSACLLVAQGGLTAEKANPGQNLTKEFCQACHHFEGSDQAGTVGPPLVAMKARFPDRKALHDLIYDPHVAKRHTMMPPFGRNGLLNDAEIELIVDYLQTL